MTQVSVKIERRVTKKLSQVFSRRENRILAALSRLDDFLINPLVHGYSGTTPERPRNAYGLNQKTNGDDSQNDLLSETGHLWSQTTRNSDPLNGNDSTHCT